MTQSRTLGAPGSALAVLNTTALADALIAEGICAEVTPNLAKGYADMLTPKPA